MNIVEALKNVGLSEGQTKIYIQLLKGGTQTARELSESLSLHRATTYDFLEQLMHLGLVSKSIAENTRQYSAAPPNRLAEILKDKMTTVASITPILERLRAPDTAQLTCETFLGTEGFRTVVQDVLAQKCQLRGLGIDENMFMTKFPHIMAMYFRDAKKARITERILTSSKHPITSPIGIYRYMPAAYFTPTPILQYRNKVVFITWEPLAIIRITNEHLAISLKKHFEMLWKLSNPIKRLSTNN
ncbi:MAG: helix-turn-helix domain-containing protein [Candidatus Woesearchaeota archaeon]